MSSRSLRLHLLRHADAGQPGGWTGPDDTRPLSDKGRNQARRLGQFLARTGFRPEVLISSPKVRAAQTAELVAAETGSEVRIDERLGANVSFSVVEAILADAEWPEDPVLVGHDPDFTMLLSSLTGADIPMRKGAMASLEVPGHLRPGQGVLRWLLPPSLLRGEVEAAGD